MVWPHVNDEDAARKFNRTESVRPIAAGDPDFKKPCARRSDSESINRGLEDTPYLNRAHSVGHARQHVNLLGHALIVNSLASTSTGNEGSSPPRRKRRHPPGDLGRRAMLGKAP